MNNRSRAGADGRDTMPHVVIVGGGFGGLHAARALARCSVRLTLVDRSNHHVFQPLLYQVATAGLAATDIAAPIRQIVRHQDNVTVLLAEVLRVDVAGRRLQLAAGYGGRPAPAAPCGLAPDRVAVGDGDAETLAYDFLILAPGAVPHDLDHPEWARHSESLKDCADALAIRRRILLAYEAAERETDESARRRWLSFAIIGGGPTGVELAGALADIARRTLARNFRNFDPGQSRIVLLEAGPRLLPAFAPDLSAIARERLLHMGVEVRTNAPVTALDGDGLLIGDERLSCGTMLRAAGVRAAPLMATLGVETDRGGRVLVRDDLSIPGHPEVFVIGDSAALRIAPAGAPAQRRGAGAATPAESAPAFVPGLAPAAMQMGRHAARNVQRALKGLPSKAFRYRDKGQLATLGRSSAVAQLGRHHFSGWLAWLLWVVVHIAYLIDFRNRLVVLFEWAWLYVTQQRGARVIIEPRDP